MFFLIVYNPTVFFFNENFERKNNFILKNADTMSVVQNQTLIWLHFTV